MAIVALDQLATDIHADIAHREEGRAQWIEGTLHLCEHLAEARQRFPENKGFGEWCEVKRFALNKDDRAAAVAMGKDLETARLVLANTSRANLQMIELKEFRVLNVQKTDNQPEPEPTATQPKPKKAKPAKSPALDIALDYVQAKHAAGEPVGDYREVGKEIGVSHASIEKAVAVVQRAEAVAVESVPVDVDQFPKTKQAELERWKRQTERTLRDQIRTEIMDEAKRLYNDHVLPEIAKKHERAERIINAYKGFIPRAAFRKVLACLHPDLADEGRKARFSEAFQIFKDLEPVLVRPEEETRETRGPPLPSTLGELMTMKRTKTR